MRTDKKSPCASPAVSDQCLAPGGPAPTHGQGSFREKLSTALKLFDAGRGSRNGQ
jgi:hypothetical protein